MESDSDVYLLSASLPFTRSLALSDQREISRSEESNQVACTFFEIDLLALDHNNN